MDFIERQTILWRSMGKALFSIQTFEYALCHYLVFHIHQTRQEAINLLEKSLRKTLGNLVCTLREKEKIPDGFEARLDSFVEERNWLAHHLFAKNSEDVFSATKFEILRERLYRLDAEAKRLSVEFTEMSEVWCRNHGMTQKAYEAEVQKRLNQIEHS